MTTRHENPKHSQGDGAGFSRLRAAQKLHADFGRLIKRSHPSADIHIDQVREYAGVQIVFYRASMLHFEHARVAVFKWTHPTSTQPAHWSKENDIIANQADL